MGSRAAAAVSSKRSLEAKRVETEGYLYFARPTIVPRPSGEM
jgi:hypothetical protein